nr:Holliday junction branch migration protein RuvA [Actibacterium sp. 188UL27-1]
MSGQLAYRGTDHIMIDVGGVGYLVFVSERTLARLPAVGEPVALHTDLLVREDLLQLFGFSTLHEKEWYRLLIGVQGIGAKAAMAILGVLGADGVGRAITLGDWSAVKAAQGVGPKIAQRVVNELKEKAPAIMALGAVAEAEPPVRRSEDIGRHRTDPAPAAPDISPASVQADALSALINLGYSHGEAARAIARAFGTAPELDSAGLIRSALKLLAPNG